MVVFHFKAFTSDCSLTPGHGIVMFLPASAINLCIGMLVTSGIKQREKEEKNISTCNKRHSISDYIYIFINRLFNQI